MLYRILLIAIFIGGVGFLFQKHSRQQAPPPPPPPPPPELDAAPPPVLSVAEIEKIRLATMDGDPSVRWAAINLLYRIRDPQAFEILQKTLKIDSESSVRHRSLDVLKRSDAPNRVEMLIGALNDTEDEIRLAALGALGEIGDPKAAPAIVKTLRDTNADVRRQALQTLGIIQAKQEAEHQAEQEKTRKDYEKVLAEHERKTESLAHEIQAGPVKSLKDLLDKNKVE